MSFFEDEKYNFPYISKTFSEKNCSNKGRVLSTDKFNYAKQYFLFRE